MDESRKTLRLVLVLAAVAFALFVTLGIVGAVIDQPKQTPTTTIP